MNTTEKRSIELRVRVRPSEDEALRKLAKADGETTVSALVRKAISNYLALHTGEGKLEVPKGRMPRSRTQGGW